MQTFISFIGSNDAGELIGKDDGAILTILKERKFDEVYLLYNSEGKVNKYTYKDIAEYLKEKIAEEKYCSSDKIIIDEIEFEDIANHTKVYPILLDYLRREFPEKKQQNLELYAGISSGTPAMQTSWVILAESDSFPINLIRAVEEKFAKSGKRVFDIELLTGAKERLEKLKNLEKRIGSKSLTNPFIVEDTLNLTNEQKKIAESDKPILIDGETGVGKEVLAKTIHENSSRKDYKLIPLNCAGLSENLIESELFGHVKGAFTGAVNDKKGIVEEYSNGTLFLDEINTLPLQIQSKLLRFLENGEFRKIGNNKIQKSNIRIIAATNEKIQKLVIEGKFREDLFYRLRTFELSIPPLRERKNQIPDLIKRLSDLKLNQDLLEILKSHDFKGNIRELRIILERLRLYSKNGKVSLTNLKEILNEFTSAKSYEDVDIPKELEGQAYKFFRKLLTNIALKKTNGNTLAAAKILGVTHPSIKKWSKD